MKKIFAICGSTRKDSVNLHILREIAALYPSFDWIIYDGIDQLPHFNPDLDTENADAAVFNFRQHIGSAAGVLICTPEYVFSLPGSLKNAMEWTVSTTLFTDKPVLLITASSQGTHAFKDLELLMTTLGAKPAQPSLLIQAPKTKLTKEGKITDTVTLDNIKRSMDVFIKALP